MSDHAPQSVPEMNTVCIVCLEDLFDEEGIAKNGEVAGIPCLHLVHSECLRRSGEALNADGKRYGIGGLGSPRAGCPICSQEVTFWPTYNEAAAFPTFWMSRIQDVLEETGPARGPIPVKAIRAKLKADDRLTTEQKKYLSTKYKEDNSSCRIGFYGALQKAGAKIFYWKVVNGGPDNGGYTTSAWKDNVWHWNEEEGTLWDIKWGDPARRPAARIHKIWKFMRRIRLGALEWTALVLVVAIVASVWFDSGEEITKS
ncbi:expressed unknown protein [Seminavis robusta]|uniref:RING-type domain-containing protein n=1 Tax=Seminavis robusta TaxID=568900 RepID=A0A9N8HEC2_9STRA|nr:expressed unknown protein [Seminavis robusta]|eukprot:Sro465_g148580.1 n/a (257) ;mRNA; f:25272-26042